MNHAAIHAADAHWAELQRQADLARRHGRVERTRRMRAPRRTTLSQLVLLRVRRRAVA